MGFHSYPQRVYTLRMSRRRVLKSALLAASGLTVVAFLGCETDEASPAVEGTPQETGIPMTPQDGGIPTFNSDGVPIHYEVFGEGRPIILVHGFAASIEVNWMSTGWIEALTPIRQVVTLDARGHGLSGKPHDPQAYAGDEMPNDVIRLMNHLDIEKADLFGYSMGAAISLRLLLRDPDRFTSVVLGGVGDFAWRESGDSPEDSGSRVAEALLAEDPATITDPTAKAFRDFAEMFNNDLEALAAYMRAPRRPVDRTELAHIALPVLIVNGELDTLVGSPDELAAAIPGARLEKIPDRDHLTVVLDPRFKEVVVDFLTEHSSG